MILLTQAQSLRFARHRADVFTNELITRIRERVSWPKQDELKDFSHSAASAKMTSELILDASENFPAVVADEIGVLTGNEYVLMPNAEMYEEERRFIERIAKIFEGSLKVRIKRLNVKYLSKCINETFEREGYPESIFMKLPIPGKLLKKMYECHQKACAIAAANIYIGMLRQCFPHLTFRSNGTGVAREGQIVLNKKRNDDFTLWIEVISKTSF